MMAIDYVSLGMGILMIAFGIYCLFWGRFPKSIYQQVGSAAGGIAVIAFGLVFIDLAIWGFLI